MQKRDIFMSIAIAIIIIFFVANMGAINNFLSVHTDKTIEFGHSNIVVPEAWNTTDEVNLSGQAKQIMELQTTTLLLMYGMIGRNQV